MTAETQEKIYILCTSDFFIESKTQFVCRTDTVKDIFHDPAFIDEHGHRFDGHFKSLKLKPSTKYKGCIEVVVDYIDIYDDPDKTSFFLLPAKAFL